MSPGWNISFRDISFNHSNDFVFIYLWVALLFRFTSSWYCIRILKANPHGAKFPNTHFVMLHTHVIKNRQEGASTTISVSWQPEVKCSWALSGDSLVSFATFICHSWQAAGKSRPVCWQRTAPFQLPASRYMFFHWKHALCGSAFQGHLWLGYDDQLGCCTKITFIILFSTRGCNVLSLPHYPVLFPQS